MLPGESPELVDVEDITIHFPNRTYDCTIREDLGDMVSEPPGALHIKLAPRTLVAVDPSSGKTLTRDTPAERIVINLLHVEQIVRRTRKVPKDQKPFSVDAVLQE
jgi:hypothetical protein